MNAKLLYRFAYSVGFAALIAASSAELDFWLAGKGTERTVIDSLIVYLLIPVCLICINSIKVKVSSLRSTGLLRHFRSS